MTNPQVEKFDLSNCDKEPIHIPGSVQPHGALLALSEPLLKVEMASRSAELQFDRPLSQILGAPLHRLLDKSSTRMISSALSLPDPSTRGPLLIRATHGAQFDGIVHRSSGLAILELEPIARIPERVVELPQLLTRVVAELRSARTLSEVCQLTAARMRDLSGYDRCMVYRFDRYFNGEVIGESKISSIPPYLGLHYPAADIPPQARRLYLENTLRVIVDVDYRASPLEPEVNPHTGAPLDLSRAVLRSVSPFHCEYLRNMGVRGTLAISLLQNGRLWGLVVLHHGEARHIRHELRATCEALGLFLSQRISELEQAETNQLVGNAQFAARRLASRGNQLSLDNPQVESELSQVLELFRSQAGVIWFSKEDHLAMGTQVDPDDWERLIARLRDLEVESTFETDCMRSWLGSDPMLSSYAGLCAAKLAGRDSWFILLRAERVSEVSWGSAKEKDIRLEDGVPRLSPEGSFGIWKETVRGRSSPWKNGELKALEELALIFRGLQMGRMSQDAERAHELRKAVEAKEEFVAQVSHELRNPLNAVLGWADLLLADGATLPPQVRRGLTIIQRNTRVQSRLIDDLLDVSRIVRGNLRLELNPHSLEPILRAALETVNTGADAKRIQIKCIVDPACAPINADADRLQQMVWNLLSNAVKFTPKEGTVTVTLREEDSSVLLSVENTGSQIEPDLLPFLFDRFKQGAAGVSSKMGLGLGLAIAKGIVELHGGTISAENTDMGVRFVVKLPVLAYQDQPASKRESVADSVDGFETELSPNLLAGLNIMVVEDEPEALEVLATVLESAGAQVEAYDSPITLLAESKLQADALLSDLGLPDMDGLELIKTLRSRGFRAPALALTAYASRRYQLTALKAGFSLHVPKPVDREQLLIAVGSLLGRFQEDGEL